MKTTPTYGISYIEGGDLVSNAAAGFKKAAETTEAALKLVDQRSTVAGVKPAIAGTLATLATMRGATGQTGYVTSDGNNNGPYCWNGSAWVKYAQNTQISSLQSQIAAITQGYESGRTEGTTSDLGALKVSFSRDHGTAPKSVMVVMARLTNAENRGSEYYPTVWEATSKNFQVRFANNGGGWSGRNGYAFYWMAIW